MCNLIMVYGSLNTGILSVVLLKHVLSPYNPILLSAPHGTFRPIPTNSFDPLVAVLSGDAVLKSPGSIAQPCITDRTLMLLRGCSVP